MTSQNGQDDWVLSKSAAGYFVEIGAYDGVKFSNSLKLERDGWNGICVEADPDAYQELAKNRACRCFNLAVYSQSGQRLPFCRDEMLSGLSDFIDGDGIHGLRPTVDVETVTLNDLLAKANSPKKIGYVSVDTEGSELEIVKEFDFDRWDVDCWTIEHNDHLRGDNSRSEALKEIFQGHGYQHIMVQQDIWFRRDDP